MTPELAADVLEALLLLFVQGMYQQPTVQMVAEVLGYLQHCAAYLG